MRIMLQVHRKRGSGPIYQVGRHLRNDLQHLEQLRQALGRRTDHGEQDQPGRITIQTTIGLDALITTLKSRIIEQRVQRGRRIDLRGLTNLTNITRLPLQLLLLLQQLLLPPLPPQLWERRTHRGQGIVTHHLHQGTTNRINVIRVMMPSALFVEKFLSSKDE